MLLSSALQSIYESYGTQSQTERRNLDAKWEYWVTAIGDSMGREGHNEFGEPEVHQNLFTPWFISQSFVGHWLHIFKFIVNVL